MDWKAYLIPQIIAAFLIQPNAAHARESYEIRTPSGAAEAIFRNTEARAAQAKVASACLDRGWPVTSNTEGMVICNHSNIDATTVLLAPRSASFQGIARFVIVPIGNDVRVQSSDDIEVTNAFGQTKTYAGTVHDEAQDLLIAAGGTFPQGTKFEGNDLGISGHFYGYRFIVTDVAPDGAGEIGGIREGDKIRKIDGHSFDDLWWFRHKVNAIAHGNSIHFDVIRGKERLKIDVLAKPKLIAD